MIQLTNKKAMSMKFSIILLCILFPLCIFSQTVWHSPKYGYSIEVPKGFVKSKAIGGNVDFRAGKGINSIIIVVKTLPNQYLKYSIWDLIGDLNSFSSTFVNGAKEYMKNPIFIKSGKTTLSGLDAFWYDYKHEDILYSKNYQIKKGNKLYTITLSCNISDYNQYAPIWYRFKDKVKIQ